MNKQIATYAASGIFALLIDNVVFLIVLYIFSADLGLAVATGLTSGLIASFALNRQWTFKKTIDHKHSTSIQLGMYILLFIFNNVFTYFLVSSALVFGIIPIISKLIATACITLWNYVLYKKIIFR